MITENEAFLKTFLSGCEPRLRWLREHASRSAPPGWPCPWPALSKDDLRDWFDVMVRLPAGDGR